MKKVLILITTFLAAVVLAVNVYAPDALGQTLQTATAWFMLNGDTAHIECAGNTLDVTGQTDTAIDLHCHTVHDLTRWHAPTDHEHGAPPPAWADEFSMNWYGHQVIYGGNETTPNENLMKHTAYKGATMQHDGMDVFARVHLASNPMDRCVQYHSYEIYVKDTAGNVSHVQGWINTGDPTTRRILRPIPEGETRPNRPVVLVADENSGNAFSEQWYMTTAPWSFQIGWNISAPTTYYRANECDAPHDMSLWPLTGNKGTIRLMSLGWFGPDSPIAPNRGNPPKDVWFCATTKGEITTRGVSHPDDCGAFPSAIGETALPQYIASTMTSFNDERQLNGGREHDAQIVMPN